MIELRWVVPTGTTTERPRLQYRLLHQIGLGHWGEWEDVPTVVVAQEPPQPASTALVAFGVNGKSPDQLRQELLSGQWDLSNAAEKPAGVRACGSNGTADCQSTAAEHRCVACPHGVGEVPRG